MKSEYSARKRRIISKTILAVLLWMVAISRLIEAGSYGEAKETIVTAFNQVQFADMSARVETFGYYGNIYLSLDAREQMVRDIGYELGMSNCVVEQVREGETMITSIKRDGTNANTQIRLITREEKITDTVIDSHQYVDIDIDLNSHVESGLYYKQVLQNILDDYDITADVTLSLTGSIEGKADMAIKDLVADRMIELMNGKIVAENRSDSLYTIYAYSKNVNDSITLGGRKINLNISSIYDEENNQTIFYVASPVINASY